VGKLQISCTIRNPVVSKHTTSGSVKFRQAAGAWCRPSQWRCPPSRPSDAGRQSRRQTAHWCDSVCPPTTMPPPQTPTNTTALVSKWNTTAALLEHQRWLQALTQAAGVIVSCLLADIVGRQRLRSATQQLMVVPQHQLSTVGRRAFAVHGRLPDDLRTQQNYESFRCGLKTWLFSRY